MNCRETGVYGLPSGWPEPSNFFASAPDELLVLSLKSRFKHNSRGLWVVFWDQELARRPLYQGKIREWVLLDGTNLLSWVTCPVGNSLSHIEQSTWD